MNLPIIVSESFLKFVRSARVVVMILREDRTRKSIRSSITRTLNIFDLDVILG